MPQSMYSKDYVAGDDWIIHYYNLTDAGKCLWWLEEMDFYYAPDMQLPLLKVRSAPADRGVAMRRAASWNSMPVRHASGKSVGLQFSYEVGQSPSVKRLYAKLLDTFQRADPSCYSAVMVTLCELVNGVNTCTMCSKGFTESHWDSITHNKRLKTHHGVSRHRWNSEIGFWEDVPADP